MQPTKLFDFIHYQNKNYPQEKFIGDRRDGKWTYMSTQQVIDKANRMSHGLLKLGVKPGDKIAQVVYANRPEWVVMDLAISQIGAINVPVYPTISPSDYEYIFNDATVEYAFCGGNKFVDDEHKDLIKKIKNASPRIDSLKGIYCFDKRDDAMYWETLLEDGDDKVIEDIKANVKETDLATLIYTSGTTGNPKGVMLSHKNLVSNVMDVRPIVPTEAGDRAISFLPLCHVFERAVLYSHTYNGLSISFAGTDNLGGDDGDLKAIKPHFFTTVPRLLEKVYEKIYNKGLELTGAKKKLFFWALDLTDDYEYDKQFSGMAGIKRKIADKLIFSKWREALGGNVKGILTGAAACPVKMAKVFSAAGIPIREGYGLTETSPGLTIGRYSKGDAMLGTVGPALDGVTIKIDPSDGNYKPGEGEILAAGDNIMMGYYNKPEATAAVINEVDGVRWFHTGDVGRMVKGPGGKEFLKITDRKKELLKTSGGKYVAPQPIENKFKEDFLIEQMMVVGEKQKFVSALILPAPDALRDWCENNGVDCADMDKVMKNPKVLAHYQSIINEFNPEFSHIEQIKKFTLLNTTWEPDKSDGSEGELTPTMKLKRRVIREKFAKEIADIYNS